MSSPPAGPVKRLGPKFAVINDVDREIEEELDLAGSEHPKHVDDEIDELLSDNDNDDDMDGGGRSGSGMKAVGGATKQHHDGFPEWTCRWDDCFRDLVGQEALVEHVQNDHIGQGRDTYICDWEACLRKGQKQASRHSLITHCRAHTGERPYTCQEPECHKTFTRSDALSKHLRSLHGIIPDPPPKKKAKEAGQASSPPGSTAGSSPIAYKRSEVDDIIAEALLSPEDESTPTLPPAPAPAPASSPAPSAEQPPVPATKGSNTTKPPRVKKPSNKKSRPSAKASASASTSASTPAQAQASSSKSVNAPPIRSKFRDQPLQLPRDSAFYHSDLEELATDVDLGSVLPRLCTRERFWNDSEDDEPALDLVRDKRRRLRRTPPRPPYSTNIDGEEYEYGNEYEYDSLDEEIPPMESTQRIVAETLVPENPKMIIPVMSRTKWQARYMMGKAKVMLLSEENEMRRKELERTLREEMELDQRMSAASREP